MGATVKTKVKNPARYDIFSALSRVATIWGSDAPRATKLERLMVAMRPVDRDRVRDMRSASALLGAAEPLLAKLTARANTDVRREIVKLMGDQARRLNEPVDRMVRSSLDDWTQKLYGKLQAGRISNTRFRGEINALTRDNIRRGPQSVSHVTRRIREGALKTDRTGGLVLSRIDEHGVRIEELSDGKRDLVRFSISAAALKRGRIKHPRLRYTLDGRRWRQARPSRTERDGTMVFEIPTRSAPSRINGRFFDARNRGHVWDLDGLAFGVGHRPLLASAGVRAAVAAWYAHGTVDGGQQDVTVRAARLRARPWLR